MRFNGIKIFAVEGSVDCAADWFIDSDDCASYEEVLRQPYRVAAVPVFFNQSSDFLYDSKYSHVDLSLFDLVLLSDVEYRAWWELDAWIQVNRISNWLLAQGSIDWTRQTPQERVIYRPWWIWHRDLQYNSYQDTHSASKSFVFDGLLGSRRPNRDFVMLSMQKYNLLDQNILTYRDIFPGAVVDTETWPVQDHFAHSLIWPYVSENLDPTWEVAATLDNSISEKTPWHIYRHTWFSIVCESICDDPVFFMAEKISKPMMAGRAFVVFGTRGFLRQLRQLGYETFHPVIDESYDDEPDAWRRWRMAFQQIRRLHEQDAVRVIQQLQPRLDHNRLYLSELGNRMRHNMHTFLRQHVPRIWLSN